jgi:hypothetical protein
MDRRRPAAWSGTAIDGPETTSGDGPQGGDASPSPADSLVGSLRSPTRSPLARRSPHGGGDGARRRQPRLRSVRWRGRSDAGRTAARGTTERTERAKESVGEARGLTALRALGYMSSSASVSGVERRAATFQADSSIALLRSLVFLGVAGLASFGLDAVRSERFRLLSWSSARSPTAESLTRIHPF